MPPSGMVDAAALRVIRLALMIVSSTCTGSMPKDEFAHEPFRMVRAASESAGFETSARVFINCEAWLDNRAHKLLSSRAPVKYTL